MTFQGTPICKNRFKKRYQELPASGRPSQSHTSSTERESEPLRKSFVSIHLKSAKKKKIQTFFE